ncbi:hypothetical protein H257_19473 [Aphanomyces astaci]|uniref:Uncharacterized protein n=1 Tax=Aphanomyces astaci TaxID=112090 RepID=W4F830_APHAT|nr:hypothetical protein H257_19473 [Aphanomyces astaci]ETV63597.1 hypothetical protein H257_19473 [Aphanomyces astaci]|eukprot:XP_009846919.1 hypothetical protein H257_19473 [Aphanomyces astaci]
MTCTHDIDGSINGSDHDDCSSDVSFAGSGSACSGGSDRGYNDGCNVGNHDEFNNGGNVGGRDGGRDGSNDAGYDGDHEGCSDWTGRLLCSDDGSSNKKRRITCEGDTFVKTKRQRVGHEDAGGEKTWCCDDAECTAIAKQHQQPTPTWIVHLWLRDEVEGLKRVLMRGVAAAHEGRVLRTMAKVHDLHRTAIMDDDTTTLLWECLLLAGEVCKMIAMVKGLWIVQEHDNAKYEDELI